MKTLRIELTLQDTGAIALTTSAPNQWEWLSAFKFPPYYCVPKAALGPVLQEIGNHILNQLAEDETKLK